ncbi:hypothetical protein ACFPM5_14945, partial [Actinomadura harenae]
MPLRNPFRRPTPKDPSATAPAASPAPAREAAEPGWTSLPAPAPARPIQTVANPGFGLTLPTWQRPSMSGDIARLVRPEPTSGLAQGMPHPAVAPRALGAQGSGLPVVRATPRPADPPDPLPPTRPRPSQGPAVPLRRTP